MASSPLSSKPSITNPEPSIKSYPASFLLDEVAEADGVDVAEVVDLPSFGLLLPDPDDVAAATEVDAELLATLRVFLSTDFNDKLQGKKYEN